MSHPDESGNIQYYKVPLYITFYAHAKKFVLRFIANCYGLWWYLRNLWREGD